MRKISTVVLLLIAVVAISACGGSSKQESQYNRVDRSAGKRVAYIPHNNVEFNNYNNAQKLYDSPSTIIWCSTTWGNPSAPIVTVPVTGKLTSSSTTFFAPERNYDVGGSSDVLGPARSIDGLYHPNPPQYRYGFTPGGQYVDFFNMPTFCTTALTKFQRQQTKVNVSVDQNAQNAQKQAEDALKRGDKAGAQRILEGALGG